MLSSIIHEGGFDIEAVVIALAVAFVIGLVISLVYRIISDEPGEFALVLVVMPMLVTSVIMIVNGNLGTSVAVLGAFGLVRFRSAPGTAMEIIFLFFSMATGLAVGMGFMSLAIIIAITVSMIIVTLNKTEYGQSPSKLRELKITIPEDLSYSGIFDDLFDQYTRFCNFKRVKTTNMGTMYELCYQLELKSTSQEKELIDAIRCRNGNLTVMMGLPEKEKNSL